MFLSTTRHRERRSSKSAVRRQQRLYALRAQIERFFNRLRNHRRIATRSIQTWTRLFGFVLSCIRIWTWIVDAA